MNIQEIMNSSLLSLDDYSYIPFPDNLKPLVNCLDSNVTWDAFGLPIHFAKYSIVCKFLYLDELADGTFKVVKQDLTGEIFATLLLLDTINLGDFHYVVNVKITIVKGCIIDVILISSESISKIEYAKNLEKLQKGFQKQIKIRNSWAYKYLYIPYYYIVKGIFFIPLSMSIWCQYFSVWLFKLLTWSWHE